MNGSNHREIIIDEGLSEDDVDRMREVEEDRHMGYSGFDEYNDDVVYG